MLFGETGMGNVLYLTMASAVGAGAGAFIPPIVKKVVGFKCSQYKRPLVRIRFSAKSRTFLILLTVAFAVLSVRFAPWEQAPFYIGFCMIAITATLVDHQIRMIPNEILLLLLAIGLPYRVMTAGFPGLLDSLLAALITAGIFLLSMGVIFLMKKNVGVGAGDLKLAVVIAFIVGLSRIYLFLFGMVAAMLLYCLGGLFFRKLTIGSAFPMCGEIMAGFVFALFAPYALSGFAGCLPLPA